ncbi:hydroxymethylbilane synthase [Aminivibrio sp.]|jgi:hydroxymethylbilane synthase|uniref:hydroxymethylbilane synthase n=1 Tax=Aminivibrio sp. TaxID=1872489 RepID=UPI001A3DF2AC|nr:hydroxymethylbilane synthase [Aminivibrio sp.]MBL3540466.1 hydroxymethylbilane synthase [Aminivibrio sp.]
MKLLTRGSTLALLQAERMAVPLREKGVAVEIVPWSTRGDRDTVSPLCSFGGMGAFSGCIEEALLCGNGDGAVHSLKDVPSCCRDGLEIASVLPRDSAEDVLVSRKGHTLETLPEGAVVGTSSPRRKAQLLRVRPCLSVREIRGNLTTRLKKLEDGLYDALVLAAAGLERMGIRSPGTKSLPFLPAPCQGIIALEAPLDSPLFSLGRSVAHRETFLCSLAERSLLRTLGVGCHVPFAALARMEGRILVLEAEILDPHGRESVRLSCSCPVASDEEAVRAGAALGERFRESPEAVRLFAESLAGAEGRP